MCVEGIPEGPPAARADPASSGVWWGGRAAGRVSILTTAGLPLLHWLGGPGRPVRAVCDPSSTHRRMWEWGGGRIGLPLSSSSLFPSYQQKYKKGIFLSCTYFANRCSFFTTFISLLAVVTFPCLMFFRQE